MTLYSLPPLLTLCCFGVLAGAALRQRSRKRIKRLFSLICLLGCLLYTDILFAFNLKSAEAALLISRIDHALIVYLIPLYIHFFHEYLNLAAGRRWIRIAYGFAFALMCITPTPYYITSMKAYGFGYFAQGGALYPLFGLGAFIATLYPMALLVRAIRAEPRIIRRKSLWFVMAGFGGMGLLNALNILPNLGLDVYPPGCFSFIPLSVFFVGLFTHDLLDMGVWLRKGLVYSLLTALVTGIYALSITFADTLFSAHYSGQTLWIQAGFFMLVVSALGPVKTRTQDAVDRLFFRGRTAYRQVITHASGFIATERNLDRIITRLSETLKAAMKIEACGLYLPAPETGGFKRLGGGPQAAFIPAASPLIRALSERPRPVVKSRMVQRSAAAEDGAFADCMDGIGAAVVLPLTVRMQLKGFLSLPEKRTGDLFSREDMDLLETLANQTALAIDNAQIDARLRQLNASLEERVSRRTRELQQALHDKEKAQEQLIRSESLAAIGQLVAGTAHELNNPLASAKSLVQSTLEELAACTGTGDELPVGELIEDLAFADKEMGRARAIIASLLDLSRQTPADTEPVRLNAVVDDALQVLRPRIKRAKPKIVCDLSPDLPPVTGNHANLGQVVLNLIQNALDAVGENEGRVWVRTGYDPATDHVVFSCQDSGPGVADAIRKDIFKPFFTTKPVGQGTGLGLYICHEIVGRHGGTLSLAAPSGPGSRFLVRLPSAGGAASGGPSR